MGSEMCIRDSDLFGQGNLATGVSGSGKSSLIEDVLYNALAKRLHRASTVPAPHDDILGVEHINKVIRVDQRTLGNTPTSNAATYRCRKGAFDGNEVLGNCIHAFLWQPLSCLLMCLLTGRNLLPKDTPIPIVAFLDSRIKDTNSRSPSGDIARPDGATRSSPAPRPARRGPSDYAA